MKEEGLKGLEGALKMITKNSLTMNKSRNPSVFHGFSLAIQTSVLRIGQRPKQVQLPKHATKYLQVHSDSESDNWSECSNEILCAAVSVTCRLQTIWPRNWMPRNWTTRSVRDRRALVATHEDGPGPKRVFYDFTPHLLTIHDPFLSRDPWEPWA